MMILKPIRTQAEYKMALAEAEALWDAPGKSPEADRLEVLSLLIQNYEARHHPDPDPDPIAFLLHVMDARGLTRKDMDLLLEAGRTWRKCYQWRVRRSAILGSRARVAEILNRVRPLSLDMIRHLSTGLGLPADVLIQPHEAGDGRKAA
ncbi:MAG: helix-turn-helix domain-containing protein [Thiobacillus sp.]